MSETQNLIKRIKALAERTNRSPATISSIVLHSGAALASLEKGRTITLASYERAMRMLDEMERS